jgi:hypothetical protein
VFNLETLKFSWGLYLTKNGDNWVGQRFDPVAKKGPPFSNNYHINMVSVDETGVFFSGLHSRALLRLRSDMTITKVCSLPEGTHNAMPFKDGVIFNDTRSDVVRYVAHGEGSKIFKVPSFKNEDLKFNGIDDSQIARQSFGRGLCIISENIVAAGSSPSTVTLYDIRAGEKILAVNLTMDIRNAIHGLEVWAN